MTTNTLAKAFTKGDLVTLIGNWDSKGTVSYRDGIVHSCGAKQMTIFDPVKGDEIGANLRPVRATGDETGVHARMSEAEAIATALKAGARIVAQEKARMEAAIARYGYGEDHGYTINVRKSIAALHEPRAGRYEVLQQEVFDRVNNQKKAAAR